MDGCSGNSQLCSAPLNIRPRPAPLPRLFAPFPSKSSRPRPQKLPRGLLARNNWGWQRLIEQQWAASSSPVKQATVRQGMCCWACAAAAKNPAGCCCPIKMPPPRPVISIRRLTMAKKTSSHFLPTPRCISFLLRLAQWGKYSWNCGSDDWKMKPTGRLLPSPGPEMEIQWVSHTFGLIGSKNVSALWRGTRFAQGRMGPNSRDLLLLLLVAKSPFFGLFCWF